MAGRLYRSHELMSDPVLGWRNWPLAKFEQTIPGRNVNIHVGDDGFRPVPGQPENPKKTIWIYGCSFTFGWLLHGDETFVARLQARFPDWSFRNFGVNGYSTFQSLLQLEADLGVDKPDAVVFTYIPGHRLRNVCHIRAIRHIFTSATKQRMRKNLTLNRFQWSIRFRPRATLSLAGEIVYSRAPFVRNFEIAEILERTAPDEYYMHLVTKKLVERACQLTEANGGKFYFAGLRMGYEYDPDGRDFFNGIAAGSVEAIDADPNGFAQSTTSRKYTFWPHDMHPNPLANRIFAEKIGAALERDLA